MVLSILGHFVFFVFLLCCLLAMVFGLPGTFLILGAVVVYGFVTDFNPIGGGMILALALLVLAGEVLEYLLGVVGAKHFGSSRRGMVASILGGFVGALFGAPLLFGFGAVLGALAGAFAGAMLIELLTYGIADWRKALRSGWGNFLGRIAGMMTKAAIAVGMVVWVGARILM